MAFTLYDAFIFDLDGTIYLGDKLIPGATETLKLIRENNAQVRFVTNNPRYSRDYYANKLNKLGIGAKICEIVTSANFTAEYLKSHHESSNIFMIGEEQIHRELTEAGLTITDSLNAEIVLISFDTTLTYKKLQNAYLNILKGARFIATNPDPVCPTPQGGLVDAGAIIAALEIATKRKVDHVIGKPSKVLADLLLRDLNVPEERCVVIGDRLNTDIKLAKNGNMKSVWIRANNEQMPKENSLKPDFIVESIAELPLLLTKE